MVFVPQYKYTFKSTLAPEKSKIELENIVNDTRPLYKRMYANDEFSSKPFCGVITDSGFKISKITVYGNPILPIIKGVVNKENDGSRIKIFMRLSVITQIALSIWIFIGLIMTIVSFTLYPLIIVLLGYMSIIIPFNFEIKKDKKAIDECINK